LIDFLNGVAGVINNYCSGTQWVSCELARFSQSSGNYYLEITDVDENGNKLRSQTAVIFKSRAFSILSRFQKETGLVLKSGMRLMLLVKANFKAEFGFSIIVDDIDPNFTVGALEIKFNQIRQTIKDKGFDLLNKQKKLPYHFSRVAVLSPSNAAGLGDFKSESTRMERLGLCKFDYYTAKFEGDGVEESITKALEDIYKGGIEKYDALVFIRGGGSTGSLQYLNEFKIVAYICRYPIPVISGIGHERDKVLIDEYARLSIDTPSKVAEYIFGVNYNNFINAESNYEAVRNTSISTIVNFENKVKGAIDNINTGSLNIVKRMELQIHSERTFIQKSMDSFCIEKLNEVEYNLSSIKSSVNSLIDNLTYKVKSNRDLIGSLLDNKIVDVLSKASLNYEIICANSHREIINKGYAIVRDNSGNIVKSCEDESLSSGFKIYFKDGIKEFNFNK